MIQAKQRVQVEKGEEQEGRELPSETYVVQAMPQVLNKKDMTITAIMALFLLTNGVSGAAGGTVALFYLVLGAIVFFAPCVVVVIQLGVLLPNEGSLFNWTVRAVNRFWGFFIGLCFWLTGVLAVTTAGSAFITVLQGLKASWLPQPWQQGLVIIVLTALAAFIGCMQMRTIQNFINMAFVLTMVAVLLVGMAGVVWVLTGHHSATNFADRGSWIPGPSTFFLFALITLNFIGASGPLNLAGELQGRGTGKLQQTIRQHLLIGAPIVAVLYIVVTTSVLIVRGSSVGPFDGFVAVQQVFGTIPEDVAVICYLVYLIAAMLFYTYASVRLIMTAGIDGFIPTRFAKLNRNRAPAAATIFHAAAVVLTVAIIYIIVPSFLVFGGSATATTTEFYTVVAASCTLIWTIATVFFFVDLVFLYKKDPQAFHTLQQFPMSLIWLCVVIGGAACLVTIAAILLYPWLPPPLIDAGHWGLAVGGLTALLLVIAILASMVASVEADFEHITEGQRE
jgi:amino acid transporter